jgi:hypothetical protein
MYAPLEATSAVNDLVFWSLASGGSISDEQRALVRVAAPATQVDINDCEERLLITLCQEYKELVRITNGFGITRGRPYEILGTRDIRYIGEGAQWVEITPLYEDGSVAMKNSGGQLSSECYLLYLDGSTRSIGDLKKHVRDSLAWKQDTEL